jgi:hypothetical protein
MQGLHTKELESTIGKESPKEFGDERDRLEQLYKLEGEEKGFLVE